MPENQLIIATHNQGKLREFNSLLAPLQMVIKSAAEIGIKEPEETGNSFAENAELKARHCAEIAKIPSLADDSGLVIPAIAGAPGIYSARWAGEGKDFTVAFARIQQELLQKKAALNSEAYFICVLALCFPDGKCVNFEGRIDGNLSFPPRGENGFGYDPVFIPQGYDVTLAEINAEEKQKISHRAAASAQFLEYCKKHFKN